MKALDIGCGSGYMTYQMAYDGAIAYGIDIIKMDDYYIPEKPQRKTDFYPDRGRNNSLRGKFF